MDMYGLANGLDIFMRNTASRKYPGIERALLIPGEVFRQKATQTGASIYLNRYIDQDPDSVYLVIQCNVLKGECDREIAHQFFDELLYDTLGMPSSYDKASGFRPTRENPEFGTMPRAAAISREILPALNDAEFKKYYDEQMKKMAQQMAQAMGVEIPGEEEETEEEAFKRRYGMTKAEYIAKNGFDPTDDSDVIDMDMDGDVVQMAASSRPGPEEKRVGAAKSFQVGGLKPIFYAVDCHVPATMQLGYNQSNAIYDSSQGMGSFKRLGGGRRPGGFLREVDDENRLPDDFLGEGDFDDMLNEALDAKYGWFVREAIEPTGDPLHDEIADMFDEYSHYGRKPGRTTMPASAVAAAADDVHSSLRQKSAANGFGDFSRASSDADDDMDECDRCGDPACKDGELCGLDEGDKDPAEFFSKPDGAEEPDEELELDENLRGTESVYRSSGGESDKELFRDFENACFSCCRSFDSRDILITATTPAGRGMKVLPVKGGGRGDLVVETTGDAGSVSLNSFMIEFNSLGIGTCFRMFLRDGGRLIPLSAVSWEDKGGVREITIEFGPVKAMAMALAEEDEFQDPNNPEVVNESFSPDLLNGWTRLIRG